MIRTYRPARIARPRLREFATQNAWIASMAETARDGSMAKETGYLKGLDRGLHLASASVR